MIKHIKIKDFSTVITGGTPSTAKNEYWDGGNIPWLNSGELNQDIIISTRNYITKEGLKNSSTRLMPPNTILIALTGSTTGVVGFLTFEACANQSVTGILPSNLHEPKYLYYYLKSIRKQVISDAYGGAQPHISQAYVKDLQIPLPPLPTQQKIASILDAADTLRQKDKALLAKYDELTQSLFLDMFGDPVSNSKGWVKVELKSLCSFKKKSIKPEDIVQGENYVALDSIEKVTGKITTLYNVDKGELKSNKFWFDNSYILYGKLRPYLNKVALPDFEGVCSTDIIPIQPIHNKSNRLFITSLLRHNSFVAFADERSSGANLPRISPTEIEKYSTINPPFELQNQFAERVKAIEIQKALAQASLDKSEELFDSLLQKAFKGELV
jgi:type I restriction enzyme S subunit